MSQNYTFIGCLAKVGLDQHLKLSPQSHILFYKVFFDKEDCKPPKQISVAGTFQFPSGTHFFSDPPFSKCGGSAHYQHPLPPSRKGRGC